MERPTMTGSQATVLSYQPALDGLRGLAWSAVFLSHAGLAPEFALGKVAMFVFFGLSGFLISATLAVEHDRTGRIRLRRFYARRALRLLPALVVFLAAWLLVAAVFGHDSWVATVPGSTGPSGGLSFGVALQGAAGALAYMTNWCGVVGAFSGYVPLGHLWSLAVEEQFYLLWAPLLILLIRRRRSLAVTAALMVAAASFVDVAWLHHGQTSSPWVYYGTDTRVGAFLVGGALGLLWSRRETVGRRWRQLASPAAVVALGLLAWSGWVIDHSASPTIDTVSWVVVSVAAPLLVVAVVDWHRTSRLAAGLSGPLLVYLGQRSYALYLWHYVWLTWLHEFGLAGVALALAASLASAELSWRLVEAPCLRVRRRLVSSPVGAPRRMAPTEGPVPRPVARV